MSSSAILSPVLETFAIPSSEAVYWAINSNISGSFGCVQHIDSPHIFFHFRAITGSNHSTHANIVSTDHPKDASLRELQWQICDLSNTHVKSTKSLC